MSEAQETGLDNYYVWESPQCPLTILLNLKLIDSVKARAYEKLGSPNETGGILLGRSETNSSGRMVVTLEDCDWIEITHERGATFTLSQKDKRTLGTHLSSLQNRKGSQLTPIGFFRTHTRSGIYLDTADFAVLQNYFPGPSSVFLLVRTGPDQTAGFFFWEGGEIRRQSPYVTFPFDREKLQNGAFTILRAPARASGPLQATPESAGRAFKARLAELAQPYVARVQDVYRTTVRDVRIPRLNRSSAVWAAVAVGVLLLVGFAYALSHLGRSGQRTIAQGFGLNVERAGRTLRLTWNPRAKAIESARQGSLRITDGALQRKIDLSARQLSEGNALYVPASDNVEFRLEVQKGQRTIADSILSVAPPGRAKGAAASVAASAPAPVSTAPAPITTAALQSADREIPQAEPDPDNAKPPAAGERVLALRQKAAEPEIRVRAEKEHEAERAAVVKQAAATKDSEIARRRRRADRDRAERADRDRTVIAQRTKPPQFAEDAPTGEACTILSSPCPPVARLEPAPAPLPAPAPSPEPLPARTFERQPIPWVEVTYQAAPESGVRKGFEKIPVFRVFERNRFRDGEEIVPAKPMDAIKPHVPMTVAAELPGQWRVELKAAIDKHGHLSGIELLSSKADERLVNLAMSAVRRWDFEPAQINGREVNSKLLVTFEFHDPPQTVR